MKHTYSLFKRTYRERSIRVSRSYNLQHLARTTSDVIQFIMLVYYVILSIDALAKSFYYIQEELITLRSLSNEEKVL